MKINRFNTQVITAVAVMNTENDPFSPKDEVFAYFEFAGNNYLVGNAVWNDIKNGTAVSVMLQENQEGSDLLCGVPFGHEFKLGIFTGNKFKELTPIAVRYNEDADDLVKTLIAQPMDIYYVYFGENSVGKEITVLETPYVTWKKLQAPAIGKKSVIKLTSIPLVGKPISIWDFKPLNVIGANYEIATDCDSTIFSDAKNSKKIGNSWYFRCVFVGANDLKKGEVKVQVTGMSYLNEPYSFIYKVTFPKG